MIKHVVPDISDADLAEIIAGRSKKAKLQPCHSDLFEDGALNMVSHLVDDADAEELHEHAENFKANASGSGGGYGSHRQVPKSDQAPEISSVQAGPSTRDFA